MNYHLTVKEPFHIVPYYLAGQFFKECALAGLPFIAFDTNGLLYVFTPRPLEFENTGKSMVTPIPTGLSMPVDRSTIQVASSLFAACDEYLEECLDAFIDITAMLDDTDFNLS